MRLFLKTLQKQREELQREFNKREEVLFNKFKRLWCEQDIFKQIQAMKSRNLQLTRDFKRTLKENSQLLKQVETLQKELSNEQKKSWFCDDQLDRYISKLLKTHTS